MPAPFRLFRVFRLLNKDRLQVNITVMGLDPVGNGAQLVTAWPLIAQIEAVYGKQSQAILTNHLTKLFFAGMSDGAGLACLSRLLAREHVPSRLSSQSGYFDADRQSVTGVPLVLPAALRQMRPGDALLVHGTLPPAHVRIKPWYRSRRLGGGCLHEPRRPEPHLALSRSPAPRRSSTYWAPCPDLARWNRAGWSSR